MPASRSGLVLRGSDSGGLRCGILTGTRDLLDRSLSGLIHSSPGFQSEGYTVLTIIRFLRPKCFGSVAATMVEQEPETSQLMRFDLNRGSLMLSRDGHISITMLLLLNKHSFSCINYIRTVSLVDFLGYIIINEHCRLVVLL